MAPRKRIAFALLLAGSTLLGCTSAAKSCPTVDCQPAITLQYRTPIAGDYTIRIALLMITYVSACPASPPGPGRADAGVTDISCDANGAVLTGVNLGNGGNETLDMVVELEADNVSTQYMVTASLTSITNGTDCALVCFQHNGVVAN